MGGTVSGTLGVTGNTTISGTTTLTGVNNTGTITNTGTFTTTGLATTNGGITNNGTLTNNGNATIIGTLGVTGNTTVTGTLTLPSLSASSLLVTDGAKGVANGNLTGDIITSGFAATLINTAVIVGTYGSSTAVPQITVDSKGRITSITTTAITAGGGTISHTIGESYGGGIVFYVYDNGQHGLIAATSDQNGGSTIKWNGSGGSYPITIARADGVGAGLKNTAIIIATQASTVSPTYDLSAFAALVCNEYTANATTGGITTTYGDWYLPSKHELNLLYLQKSVVGGFASDKYWSSSETSSYHIFVWYQNFADGVQNSSGKWDTHYVRAIRAF